MAYKQIVSPNLSIKGRAYWCLEYARKVFGAPAVESSAWEAWQKAQGKHTTRTLPNVAVPVYFSWSGTVDGIYKNWGHVAVYVPNKGIYSSPLTGTGHKLLASLAEIEKVYGVKYVGWAETISNVRVVEVIKENDMVTKADLDAIYQYGPLGRKRGSGEGEDVYLGKPSSFVLKDHYNSAEAKRKREADSKPKEIIKEVEVIKERVVEVPVKVEVEKIVEVIKDDEQRSWWDLVSAGLRKLLGVK